MQATKQQQIVVYFIEEAKEHLDTIEQGLLSLQETTTDSERLNELFRAAHSVKGGAAMLGFTGIQKVGHHLEDCFKLLKDYTISVDSRLEDLFLQVFDVLKSLVEELQSPYGLREQTATQAIQSVEPIVVELEHHLRKLISGGGASKPAPTKPDPKLPGLINAALKKMLQLFKQGDTTTTRQQLGLLCTRMVPLHPSLEWQELLQTAQTAIAHPKNSFASLAPIVIKEIKQAGDLLLTSRASEITPSPQLRRICPVPEVAAPTPNSVIPTVLAKSTVAEGAGIGRSAQVMVPLEPRAAARVLLDAFNKEQLIELAEFLMKAIQ